MSKKTTVLMILDGFGLSSKEEGNAIKAASTPNIDMMYDKFPNVKGYASGLSVGLPDGQMGNSEVGHLNIGAGRIVYQELTRISHLIETGEFFQNPDLLAAVENCKKNDSALHLFGLLSDGGVHSHNTHLYALVALAKNHGLKKVFIHAFLDGRDTAPNSGINYLHELSEQLSECGVGKIATVMGRYYAMDRDKRWERVQLAYEALVNSKGKTSTSVKECIESSYAEGVTDEFVVPTIILEDSKPIGNLSDNDSVICFNFRPDRAREITRAIVDPAFDEYGFKRECCPKNLTYVCFTQYDATIMNVLVSFKPQSLANTLGEYISSIGKAQLRLAETEKYAHVTFFFNGGVEAPNNGEDRILVPSPKVATYDLQPEMSAYLVTDELIGAIESKKYDLIVINYANSDMVGHTGIFEAAKTAIEVLDKCLGRVFNTLLETDAQMFLCADHGNSDQMIDYETNGPFTAHTTNPVPFVLLNYVKGVGLRENGVLADIAPTLLEMMGIDQPKEMTGKSLLNYSAPRGGASQ